MRSLQSSDTVNSLFGRPLLDDPQAALCGEALRDSAQDLEHHLATLPAP
jgi:hypothetical protein